MFLLSLFLIKTRITSWNFTGATFALATHVYTSMHKGRLHINKFVAQIFFREKTTSKGLITWAGLARLAGLVRVRRDLGMSVKRNKNQLRDYMTTGPARTKAARLM